VKLIYSHLDKPICKRDDCDITENPEHWVEARLNKQDAALLELGRAFVRTFGHDLRNDKEMNGADTVECVGSLYANYRATLKQAEAERV